MKIQNALILALLILTGITLQAAPTSLTVAVYDFKGNADTGVLGENVTTLLTADLTGETNITMVERSELNKALNEQAFGTSGMVSSDAAAKIGKVTGAKVLVSGQVIKTGSDHVVIVANIIGTETGRLFADKVEGSEDSLVLLASDLSRKIAQTITDQATNLATPPAETHDELVARIAKSVTGPNRPVISVDVRFMHPGGHEHSAACEEEFGELLLKSGFTVVDENSDQKPEIEITGTANYNIGDNMDGMYYVRGVLEVKVQERHTGKILFYDHQESTGTDPGQRIANRGAQVNGVDGIAIRLLPLLAK